MGCKVRYTVTSALLKMFKNTYLHPWGNGVIFRIDFPLLPFVPLVPRAEKQDRSLVERLFERNSLQRQSYHTSQYLQASETMWISTAVCIANIRFLAERWCYTGQLATTIFAQQCCAKSRTACKYRSRFFAQFFTRQNVAKFWTQVKNSQCKMTSI